MWYSRQSLRNLPSGHGGDELTPDEGPGAEEQAPEPLVYRQTRRTERHATELDNYYLELFWWGIDYMVVIRLVLMVDDDGGVIKMF